MHRTRRALATTLALLLAASGCGGSDSAAEPASRPSAAATEATTRAPTATPAPAEPTVTPEPASAGCAAAPPTTASVEERTLATSDGLERTYRLAVPTSDAGAALPVVLDFHGLSSNAEQQALISGWEAEADALGVVAVHPQGTSSPQGLPYWNLQSGLGTDAGVDDVAFVGELLDSLEGEFCIDPRRVYSTGLSNGGYFSALLACRMADRIAAIATVAAIMHADDCAPSRPVPVLAFHGTDDQIVPFDGGESSLTAEGGILNTGEVSPELAAFFAMKMPEEVAEWAAESSCDIAPTVEAVSETVERRVYDECTEGSAVEFYVIDGGGHSWPGSALTAAVESFVGPTTFDIDATELSWEFFSRTAAN